MQATVQELRSADHDLALSWSPQQRAAFMSEQYLKSPYLLRGGGVSLVPCGQWTALERLVASSCDLVLARDGVLWQGARPQSAAVARQLHQEGWSVVARQTQHVLSDVAQIADHFAVGLSGRIDIHLYATPRTHGSFGWHVDPEEVFIIQTVGEKEYRLRENTVLAQPMQGAMPTRRALMTERSTLQVYRLCPGDLLYIPGGWWHDAVSIEDSISLSVGVMAMTVLEALDLIRASVVGQASLRTRLPSMGQWAAHPHAQPTAAYLMPLRRLAADVSQQLTDPEFISAWWHMRSSSRSR